MLGGHEFLERKIGGYKIFDDQHVGSHKMTTDSVFILFKKTVISIHFSLFRGKVYCDKGGHKIFVAKIGRGIAILLTLTFC